MKRLLLLGSVAVCMVIMMSTNQAIAQEEESTTVQITIKEDGKVTTDTTFELKEGQDHDMVKKMVQHMAGGDEKMMKKGGGNMMIISEEEHVEWTEEDGENVEVYVIKKGDKDVKVVKKVTVEIEDESEEDVEKEVEVEVEVKAEKKK